MIAVYQNSAYLTVELEPRGCKGDWGTRLQENSQ